MSRALRVKINNNLQVAVCWRVGWPRLQRLCFSGCTHQGHGLVLILFLLESKPGHQSNLRNFKQPSKVTILLCVSFDQTAFHKLFLHCNLLSYPKSDLVMCSTHCSKNPTFTVDKRNLQMVPNIFL